MSLVNGKEGKNVCGIYHNNCTLGFYVIDQLANYEL